MHLKVGDQLGFNAGTDAIYFGTIQRGGSGLRGIVVKNNDNSLAKVKIIASGELAKWVLVSEPSFELAGNESRSLEVWVYVPEDAEFRNYTGTLEVHSFLVAGDSGKMTGLVAGFVNTSIIRGSRINLIVNNTSGARIASANVSIWAPGPVLNETGVTDANGTYLSGILAVAIYEIYAEKTGYAIWGTTANVTIGSTQEAAITLPPPDDPMLNTSPEAISTSAKKGNMKQVTLSVLNEGGAALYNVTLVDNSTWISLGTGFISSIVAGGSQNVNVNLGPISTIGTYNGEIFLNSSNDGNKTVPVSFVVTPKPTPPGPSGGGGGGGGAGSSLNASQIGIVSYPTEESVIAGEILMFIITVENLGYLPLRDVTLQIQNLPGTYTMAPEELELLEVFGRQTFLVDVRVREDAIRGSYPVGVTAVSDKASDSVVFPFVVMEKPTVYVDENVLSRELAEIRTALEILWGETLLAQTEGKDVSGVFSLLNEVKSAIGLTEDFIGVDDIGGARNSLDSAKSFMQSAALALSKARSFLTEAPVISSLYLVLILMAFVALVGFTITRTRKYDKVMKAYDAVKKYKPPEGITRSKTVDKKAVSKLEKQLELIEVGHRRGYISEEAYKKSKVKIESMLKRLSEKS